MDRFERDFEHLDVQTQTMDEAMSGVTTLNVPEVTMSNWYMYMYPSLFSISIATSRIIDATSCWRSWVSHMTLYVINHVIVTWLIMSLVIKGSHDYHVSCISANIIHVHVFVHYVCTCMFSLIDYVHYLFLGWSWT